MKNVKLTTLFLSVVVTTSVLSPTLKVNADTIYKENNTSNSFNELNINDLKKENIHIITFSSNSLEYKYSSNGKNFLVKEFIETTSEKVHAINTEYYEVLMDGSNKLINTSNTIIDEDNENLTVTDRNSTGKIIDINNYNLIEESEKIKNDLGINKPTIVTRSAKKYDVYTYKRTDYGYKNIRAYKYSVGVLASIIATMVTGGAAAFFSVAAFLAGTSYDEVWTKSLVYYKYNRIGRNRTKFVTSFYSDSSRNNKIGPTVTTIEKGLR